MLEKKITKNLEKYKTKKKKIFYLIPRILYNMYVHIAVKLHRVRKQKRTEEKRIQQEENTTDDTCDEKV